MFRNLKISKKILSAIIIVAIVMFALFYFIAKNAEDRIIQAESKIVLEEVSSGFNIILEKDTKTLSIALDLFLDNNYYKDIFIENDREKLYFATLPLFEKIKKDFEVTHFYFHTKDGYNFLRVHSKNIYDDKINRFSFLKAQETQVIGSGIELGKTAFALRVVKPYYNEGNLIGYVEFGQEIDNFLDILKKNENSEFSIFVEKKYLSKGDWESVRKNAGLENNWDDFTDNIIIDSTITEEALKNKNFLKKCFNSENSKKIQDLREAIFISTEIDENGKTYMCSGLPLYDAGDRLVGSILVIKDFSEFISISNEVQNYLEITSLIFAILLFIIYFIFIHLMIIKPIKYLSHITQEISKGNLKKRLSLESEDEIGTLAKSFNKMTNELLANKANIENKVAERTEQLEKLNQSMVGRELKMIELKKEIQKLKDKGV